MTYQQVAAMFILLAVGLPIASAHARLPKPKSKAIVVQQSIGGVAIGSKFRAVTERWGKNKRCQAGPTTFTCTYRGGRAMGSAHVVQIGGRVRTIAIGLGADAAGRPVYAGPLMKFRTRDGIGLGSPAAAVRAAYPAAQSTAADVLTIGAPGGRQTTFALRDGVVHKIGITAN